ncbi:MAG: hypothetical protein M1825_001231 [Sarcosagium campestre]|nr:MAG: hypothetical protein M1825_001231 [Sarcosagium campestre]
MKTLLLIPITLNLISAVRCIIVSEAAAAGANANQTSPPYYPSPWGTGDTAVEWAEAYDKARSFVSKLTLLEKVNLTTGAGWQTERCVGQTGSIPRLGFRSLCLQDSPMGVRNTDYNTAFPGGVTVAATFDRGLMYARGYAMGEEFRDKGVDVQLGPVAGPLGRHPDGGRNWEGFSPDPVLTGIGMAQTIKGIQDAGTIACAKHYILNEQEHFRQGQERGITDGVPVKESLSSNIDDRTMHELYLWPFADAVRAGVGSVMCSYNQINNSYGCQNSAILNHLLKDELGFPGFVLSDWGAHHSGVGSALAGLDMSMPGDTAFNSGASFWGGNLTLAVLNSSVPEWRIDDMAHRIVAAWYKVGRDKTQVPINFDSWTLETNGYEYFFSKEGDSQAIVNQHIDVRRNHRDLVRNVASRGTVLLKNTNNTLPLKNPRFIAIIGQDAGDNAAGPNGCDDRGCGNGTLAQGWGSGTANYPYLITPANAIQNQANEDGAVVQAIFDNNALEKIENVVKQASVALVFVSSDSGEGYITVDGNIGDRNNLTLWHGGEQLVKTASANCNNTIVIMHTVGPVLVDAFVDDPNVTAIVWAGLPGQESGNSIADILYGRVNPGGKSPFTWGKKRGDYGPEIIYRAESAVPQANFEEGVYIDYRAFDKASIDPVFEFGFGLSYTTFAYSNLQIINVKAGPYVPGSGTTDPAPETTNPASDEDLDQYRFPDGAPRIKSYIYPYLPEDASVNAGNDTDSIPTGAYDTSPQPILPAGGAPGGNPSLYDVLYHVTATVTNTGDITGEEVAQLYVSLGGPDDPPVVLRGFERLSIGPKGTTTFAVDLTRRDLANWDVVKQDWVVSERAKTVYVGSSSRKLELKGTIPAVKVVETQ